MIGKFEDSLKKGQTNLSTLEEIDGFTMDVTYNGYKYLFVVTRISVDRLKLCINDSIIYVRIRDQSDGSLLCTYGGLMHKVYGQEEPLGLRMVIDGCTVVIPYEFNPSELRSDITGKILRFLHQDGTEVCP